MDKIKAPTLLLHGSMDERIPVQQARAFAEKLMAHGVKVKLVVFPKAGHSIPFNEQFREIIPFLESYLR